MAEKKCTLADLQRPPLPKEVKELPDIAWPTVILTVVFLSIHAAFHYGYIYLEWNYWMCLAGWGITDYFLFTAMHDACHSAIATHKGGYFWLNDCIGRLAIIPYMGSFNAFRMIHLTHHKYTNVEGKDPAYFAHSVPRFFKENPICQAILKDWRPIILPLKWMLVPNYLIYFYFSRRLYRFQNLHDRTEAALNFIITQVVVFYLYFVHGNSYIFDTFFRGVGIAIFFLSITFDYLPHRNIHSTEPYEASSMVSLKSFSKSKVKPADRSVQSVDKPMFNTLAEEEECDPWHIQLTGMLFFNQNYHTCHHLYPSIPWYRYTLVWHVYSEYIKFRGAEVLPLFPFYRDEVETDKKED